MVPADVPSPDLDNAIEELLVSEPTATILTETLIKLRACSRENGKSRQRLGNPNVLDKLIETTHACDTSVVSLALSCIGNAVIDNHAAREHVSRNHGFDWAARLFTTEKANTFEVEKNGILVGVLNNICHDSPTTLSACSESRCFRQTLHALDGHFHVKAVPMATELLFQLGNRAREMTQEEGRTVEQLQPSDLGVLMKVPRRYFGQNWQSSQEWLGAEDWASLVSTVLLFAKQEDWLEEMIAQNGLLRLWRLLEENEAFVMHLKEDGAEEDDVKLVAPLSASLLWVLSDAATNPYFRVQHPLTDSAAWDTIFDAIKSLDRSNQPSTNGQKAVQSEIVSAAGCQILANVLWIGQPFEFHLNTVERQHIHMPILAGILSSDSANTLHSITGLLWMWILTSKSLIVAEAVGDDERIVPALQKLLSHEMPQVVTEGKNLLRALGKYSERNRERFRDLSVQAAVAEYNENNAEGPQMSIEPSAGALT